MMQTMHTARFIAAKTKAKAKAAHAAAEARLDAALAETFPASDPVAITITPSPREKPAGRGGALVPREGPLRARDLMTGSVVTVSPETPVAEVARILAARGLSGLPVVDEEGRLVGLVTEGDLIRRLAAPEDRPRAWIRGLFASRAEQAAHYARTHGRLARDVMTRELVTVEEEAPIERVASLLERHRIRRLPVLREGVLAGVVSRADLMRALLAAPAKAGASKVPDHRIGRQIAARMREQPWADTYLVFPSVEDGVVTFHGFCRSVEVERALRVLAEGVPGVKAVRIETTRPPRYMFAAA